MTKKTERQPSFDKALTQLEAIVQEMENGSLPLEKTMEQFEEGMRLIALCSAKLEEVERKIEILAKKGDKVVAEPFIPDKSSAAENSEMEGKSDGKSEKREN